MKDNTKDIQALMDDVIQEVKAKEKIEECMKVLKRMNGCIEKGIQDLQEILDEKGKTNDENCYLETNFQEWRKWHSYHTVVDLVERGNTGNNTFIMALGRFFYAMSMKGYESDSANVFLKELKPLISDDKQWEEIMLKAATYFPTLLVDESNPNCENLDQLLKGWEESRRRKKNMK